GAPRRNAPTPLAGGATPRRRTLLPAAPAPDTTAYGVAASRSWQLPQPRLRQAHLGGEQHEGRNGEPRIELVIVEETRGAECRALELVDLGVDLLQAGRVRGAEVFAIGGIGDLAQR